METDELESGTDSKIVMAPLPPPSALNIFRLHLQMVIGCIFLLPFNHLIVFIMTRFRGYSITNLRQIREMYRQIAKEKRPLIICSNHLTFIDSAIMLWAMGGNFWYQFHYRYFSWNLPAGDFFKKSWVFRTVAYLSKCIFIHRDGSREHKNMILGLCRYLVEKGQVITIFPEGRRSRKGVFEDDHMTLGVSQILTCVPGCRVLCVYLRGDKQKHYSNYPEKNSKFHLFMEVITPESKKEGRRALVDLSSQIGQAIKRLEHAYFARFGHPEP